MSEEYLWDRSGEPDPEVERLERVLSPFRYQGSGKMPQRASRTRWVAAIAALAACLAIAVWWAAGVNRTPPQKTAWQAVAKAGAPTLNGHAVETSTDIYTGQRIETDAASRVQVRSDFIGEVDLEPNSEMY